MLGKSHDLISYANLYIQFILFYNQTLHLHWDVIYCRITQWQLNFHHLLFQL